MSKSFSARLGGWLRLLLVLASVTAMGAEAPTEFQIKAAFLLKFIQFVDWPDNAFPSPQSPMVIGVLGNDPFGHDLDDMCGGEVWHNHRVVIRRFRNWKEIPDVQVLYVSSSERGHLHSILSALGGRSILTVSDLDDFSAEGGIIHFVIARQKVHFQINASAARRANLKISSKLLQLAEPVEEGSR